MFYFYFFYHLASWVITWYTMALPIYLQAPMIQRMELTIYLNINNEPQNQVGTTHPQKPNQKHFSLDSWKIALPMKLFSYRKAFMPNDGKGFCRKSVPLFSFVSAEKRLHKHAFEVFICLLLFIPWYIASGAISIFRSSFPKLYKWPPLISATVGASYQFHFYAHSPFNTTHLSKHVQIHYMNFRFLFSLI